MRHNSIKMRFIYVAIASLYLLVGCEPAEREAQLASEPVSRTELAAARPMPAILDSITNTSDPNTNIFRNAERAQMQQQLLADAPSLRDSILVSFNLGVELLLSGHTRRAIDTFEFVRRELRQAAYDPDNRRRLRDVTALLGLSYLRLGEQENCILKHSTDSCIFPIESAGVHQLQEGSRTAIKVFTELLQKNPEDVINIWLLNIAYMTVGEYPDKVPPQWRIPEASLRSDYDIGRFRDIAPHLGLDLVGLSGGSIMEDFDNDGHLDIMASSWGLGDQLHYYRNNGDGSFTDRTDAAGLTGQVGGLDLFHADYDNDGYRDVVVPRGAWMKSDGRYPNSLLRNMGDGTFRDLTAASGILSFHPTHVVAWADYDNDGWLDLFVGNESDQVEKHPCQLFRNNTDGTFTDVAPQVGLDHECYVKGVTWGDYDNDGLQDLYISCLGRDNALFRNRGESDEGWRFDDMTASAGVAKPFKSFPTWFWDYDNDGWLDLLAASFYVSSYDDILKVFVGAEHGADQTKLYRNNGDGTFSDRTKEMGLEKVILAMGANFGDLDNDGFLDCYFGTGDPDLRSLMPNLMYRNNNGKVFQDVTTSGGFGNLQKGHGISFGDLDHDGDQDIFEVMGGAYTGDVYQNVLYENPGHDNNWITLRLHGVRSNRDGIGARIRVQVKTESGSRDIYSTVSTGGSFGSSSLQQEIGLGKAVAIELLEIKWPAGATVQRFRQVAMNRIYDVDEDGAELVPVNLPRINLYAAASKGDHGLEGH